MDYFAFEEALRKASDLTHAEFRVLVNLSTYADADLGNAAPGDERLFAAACVSPSVGKRALRGLRTKGWLQLIAVGANQRQAGKPNTYRLTIPHRINGPSSPLPGSDPKGNAR